MACASAFVTAYGAAAADEALSLQRDTASGDKTLIVLRVLDAIWTIEGGLPER
ncbi:MAG: hypothetical protein QM698_05120 [Micropepsaceae bacterium]